MTRIANDIKVSISAAANSEHRAIAKLDSVNHEGWTVAHIDHYLQSLQAVLTVARYEGQVVGFCAYRQDSNARPPLGRGLKRLPGIVTLARLAVDANWQGLGVGRQLLERAVESVSRRRFGSFRATLELSRRNVDTAKFLSAVLEVEWWLDDSRTVAEWWSQRRAGQ